jgi:Ran GTPase-activating protein (RanGAP) involved in mRNA processing and transport
MNSSCGEALAHALSASIWHRKLSYVDIASNPFGPKGSEKLFSVLQSKKLVKYVDVSNCNIIRGTLEGYNKDGKPIYQTDATAMNSLMELMKNHESLTYIDLSKNGLGAAQLVQLSKAIKESNSLVDVDLSYNDLGRQGLYMVLLNLSVKKMDTLTLKGCGLSEGCSSSVGEFIKSNKFIKHLRLSHNQLGGNNCKQLFGNLKTSTTLVELDISWNKLGSQGAVVLAGVFDLAHKGLQILNVSCCDLTDNGKNFEGVHAMFNSLKLNRGIQKLIMQNNQLVVKKFSDKLLRNNSSEV